MLNSASAVRNEQVIKPQGALAPSVHCKKKQQVPPLRSGGTCCFPPPRNRFMECFRPSLSPRLRRERHRRSAEMRLPVFIRRVWFRQAIPKLKQKSNAILANRGEIGQPLVGLNRERRMPAHQQVPRAFQNPQLRALSVDLDVIRLRQRTGVNLMIQADGAHS